ncbi:hypothetical protein [Cellulomonas soli]|uniref:Uncharacterized protein n=1 Tax=Cellulomonas soli TaxID=931535 RepID=A0A512P8K4_9CELL|nr:hypothetical protein [Cellulomonas soli]NYI57748.1 hypothetical protein [Cellulomonas soli]GEP67531.1 hypothetical protein CSO01_02460 [Cellulomonas soli]
MSTQGWGSDEWEEHSRRLLRLRYGIDFVPVPDKSGGDGGLDGFVRREAIAWQFYAPEGEPLQPSTRYARQRDKITTDVKKLKRYSSRVEELLGETILRDWVLLTPVHESSDLISHCNAITKLARSWDLPFLAQGFNVSVQDLDDLALEHKLAQASGLLPEGLRGPIDIPELTRDGGLFSQASGPRIGVMDGKLKKIISSDEDRAYFRGELLKSKFATADLLDRYDTRVPDIAQSIRFEIGQAKRGMLMSQTLSSRDSAHLGKVQEDVRSRIVDVAPGMPYATSHLVAEGTVCEWLEECSMDFSPPETTE